MRQLTMTDNVHLDAIIILLLLAAVVWGWTAHCPHGYWPDHLPDGRQERRLQTRFHLLLSATLPLLCGVCGWLVSLH
jgi:hypothetical protein